MENVGLNVFFSILWILSYVRVVQHRVTIDKHAKIHLNDRKYQIYWKIIETYTWQHRCCLLYIKKVLGVYKMIIL